MHDKLDARMQEIVSIASTLKWFEKWDSSSYAWMQISEVEKCMLMMSDDSELKRFHDFAEKVKRGEISAQSHKEYLASKS